MAFTRQNVGQNSTFTRSGAVQSVSVPGFQVFNVDTASTNYSLGSNWSIKINTTLNTLSFNYYNSPKLTVSESGFQLSSFILPSVSSLPESPSEGTLVRHNNEFKIYI